MDRVGGQLVAYWQRIWKESRVPSGSKYLHDDYQLTRIDLSIWEYDAITAFLYPLMTRPITATAWVQETLFGVPIYITGC